jgi:hypothetical protein
MIIWFALIIPIITSIVLLVYFRHKTTLWEFAIPIGVSIVLIVIFKLSVETYLTSDTEYWGGYVTKVRYYEDWNEYIHKICTETYACGTDSKGNTRYCTRTYDCSYVDYHPPYWQIIESNGFKLRISKNNYARLKAKFGTPEKFVDLKRNYHTNDGDMYQVAWGGEDTTLESITTMNTYENRVQASQSTFNYYEVDPTKDKLYEYPKPNNNYYMPVILGPGGPTKKEAERKFQLLNAKLGRTKQVRVFVLIFVDKPLDVGHDQENYWVGGNKNEFTIAIGVDKDYNVSWCHSFSWTEVELLKVETNQFVQEQETLDLVALADWLYPKIKADYIRLPFSRFNYLSVEPPMWAIIVTFIVTLLANVGISLWVILNRH